MIPSRFAPQAQPGHPPGFRPVDGRRAGPWPTPGPSGQVRRCRRSRGVALVIVLLLLVVIGLTSASAMRNASSGVQLTRNLRLQNLAEQYAEAALRYCESELARTDGERVASLREAVLTDTPAGAADAESGWGQAATWRGAGAAGAALTVVPESWVQSAPGGALAARLPECVAERQELADGNRAYVVTARGFSPGYRWEVDTGQTTAGSVVWLQSVLLLGGGAP